jgi:poly(3-hydroxybutyrate) depolymerase
MHGGNGNRSSLLPGALIMAQTGAVCLLIDSPLNGARAIPGERLSDFSKPERMRDALIQTVIDLRRGVDVLVVRKDVDPKRIGYIGASFGGTVGGILAGVEKRIAAYALLVGTGDLTVWLKVSDHPSAKLARLSMTPEQLEHAVQILSDVQPIHYIGRAAPSAVFFQNGRQDPFMPIAGVEKYHAAGSEPKLVKWYEAGHGLNAESFRDRAEWFAKRIGIGHLPASALKGLGAENTK